jgi:hypothetical protein
MKPILILANLKSHFDALEKCLREIKMPHYPQGYYLSRDILKNVGNKEEFEKLCEENLYSGVIISFPESDESQQTNLMSLEKIAKANALPIIFLCNIERGYLDDAPAKENFLCLEELNLELPQMLISKNLILVK